MSGSIFTWVGGKDVNGANNWITPADWTVAGVAATRFPNLATDNVIINVDDGTKDAIISGGQSITIGTLSIGGATAGAVQGGHLLVGGSSAIGGGGGGTLTVTGAITITSPNSGGAIVGGNNGVVNAPSMTINGGPSVLIGGGGTFDIPTMVNNGGILADGGIFGLGPLVLNDTAITGTGFMEVSGPSTMEINAATAQEVRVLVAPRETATVIFDKPGAFTGSLNLLNPNSNVDLLFAGETPTGVTFDANAHTLVITGAGGALLNTIPFTSNGVVPLKVTPSTKSGFGEVVIGPGVAAVPAGTLALNGPHDQYVIASNNGTLFVQDSVAGRDGTPATSNISDIQFTDGKGLFDPTGTAENISRLYSATLGRAADDAGIKFWTSQIDGSHVPLSQVAGAFAASPEFIHTYGSLSDPAFVQQLYQNVLHRAGDAPGVTFWTGALGTGSTRGDVAQSFAESPENRAATRTTAGDVNDAEAFRLYQAALGRAPDQAGQTFWSTTLANGASPTQVAQGFIATPEFQKSFGGLSVGDFVTKLYQNVLHRAGDPAGQQFWTNALSTGTSQANVVVAFSDGIENRAATAGATHANWVFVPA